MDLPGSRISIPKEQTYAYFLAVTNPIRQPLIQSAIRIINFPEGSCGLDIGCGIGFQSLQLAEAVGKEGHVTGLDISNTNIDMAKQIAAETPMARQITFQQGDWNLLSFVDESFDWIWAVDSIGYATQNSLEVYKNLAKYLKPGGLIAILCWSSQMLLPGYPFLEARLNSTKAGYAPFVSGMKPEDHYLRNLGQLFSAGFINTRAQTFVNSVCAPLTKELIEAMTAVFEMRWWNIHSELSADDWALYQNLTRQDSAEFLLNKPDYYAFFTYSLFTANKPSRRSS